MAGERHCVDPGESCKCGNLCNRMQKRCPLPVPVLGPRLFLLGTLQMWHEKKPCTNVVGRPGSKLSQQLGVERIEIFCIYWPH